MILFNDLYSGISTGYSQISTSASYTDFSKVIEYSSYNVEEIDNKKVIKVIATGVKEEDVNVRFKGENVFISIKGNSYLPATDLTVFLGFTPKKDLIKVYLESGILNVEIGIPEDYEFEVNLERV